MPSEREPSNRALAREADGSETIESVLRRAASVQAKRVAPPEELRCPGCDAVRDTSRYQNASGFGHCPSCATVLFMPPGVDSRYRAVWHAPPSGVQVESANTRDRHHPSAYRAHASRDEGQIVGFSLAETPPWSWRLGLLIASILLFTFGAGLSAAYGSRGMLGWLSLLLIIAAAVAARWSASAQMASTELVLVRRRFPLWSARVRVPRDKIKRFGVVSLDGHYVVRAYVRDARRRPIDLVRSKTATDAMYARALLEEAFGLDAIDDWRNPR